MDDGYVIVRLGALRDLVDLTRIASDVLSGREPDSALAREMRGAAAQVEADLTEPAFA